MEIAIKPPGMDPSLLVARHLTSLYFTVPVCQKLYQRVVVKAIVTK